MVRRITLVSFVIVAALSAAFPVQAQWTDVGSTRAANEREAIVRSEDAAELRLWLDPTQAVHVQFTLPRGLVAFAEQGCVTIQVDEHAMQDLSAAQYECTTDGAKVQLLLARIQNEQVNSDLLSYLMNGNRVSLRYRLSNAGYGAAQFSLKGSKQALSEALGKNIAIVGK